MLISINSYLTYIYEHMTHNLWSYDHYGEMLVIIFLDFVVQIFKPRA